MRHLPLWLSLLFIQGIVAQVKLGTNSENIDPASLLELESTDRALVITRVNTSQMENIAPLEGGLVYNTEENCLFYYSGQRWINLCEALGLTFTNDDGTIIITEEDGQVNLMVGQIRGGPDTEETPNNIVDRSIRGEDIGARVVSELNLATPSVGSGQLFDQAVTTEKIEPGAPRQVLTTTNLGTVSWSDPAVVAWGKWSGSLSRDTGISSVDPIGGGDFLVTFDFPMDNSNYTIQATPLGNIRVFVTSQDANGFIISMRDALSNAPANGPGFFVTVFDN